MPRSNSGIGSRWIKLSAQYANSPQSSRSGHGDFHSPEMVWILHEGKPRPLLFHWLFWLPNMTDSEPRNLPYQFYQAYLPVKHSLALSMEFSSSKLCPNSVGTLTPWKQLHLGQGVEEIHQKHRGFLGKSMTFQFCWPGWSVMTGSSTTHSSDTSKRSAIHVEAIDFWQRHPRNA